MIYKILDFFLARSKLHTHLQKFGPLRCDHILEGAGTKWPTSARKEWYSGCFADPPELEGNCEPKGAKTLHYIHFTCMLCGNTVGDKPYGDTKSPYPATTSVRDYDPIYYGRPHI